MSTDQPHAHNYPGVPLPTPMKCREAVNDDAALEEGFSNSMGTSADGSHKGLPSGKHPAAQEGVKNPKGSKYHSKTGAAAEAEGKTASRGTSGNGSHKDAPGDRGPIGQRRGANPGDRGPVRQ